MQPPPSTDRQPRPQNDSTPPACGPTDERRIVGGHFELGELLGLGGTSSVYACKGFDAAIKIFDSVDEDARRRFLDEGRLLTRLRHPHLVHVIAVGETDTGAPYMVLERFGENLDRRVRRDGPLPWLEVVELIAQVASALAALHQLGVIHRDVKPNNIVTVKSATGEPFVKLIDLGGAKVEDWRRVQGSDSEPVTGHQTEVGVFVGTAGFFPPEAGFVRPTPGFDVFGLGATIYVLCTGELPNHIAYRPMREARPECGAPPELEALVVDAMALTPEDRIASVAEFQRRLERVRAAARLPLVGAGSPRPPNSHGWTFYTTAGEGDATPTAGVPAGRRALASQRIGDGLELGELLGSGGTSSVWACKNLNVAVKILSIADDDARRRFLDEGRLLTHLRHPHLVQVLAVGETDTRAPFMVLERLTGENLDARLKRDGPLHWLEVVDQMSQVASAIAALHRVGVIHRDVKPGNIVAVKGATDRPFVKLIDLGGAKVEDWQRVRTSDSEPAARHPTELGRVVGTPGFIPPEAALVRPTPGFDVFGLGATIFLLCTGELPDHLEYRPMREVRPECAVPPELEALVAHALAPLPEDRIASMTEFQRRLERVRVAHVEDDSPFLFEGCYELLDMLGSGAKGEVHRAYDRNAGRYVALKILDPSLRNDAEARLRFVREARALSAVQHSVLPQLLECRTSPTHPRPYLVMTLMPGKPASDLYFGGERLKPADVLAIGRALAGALAALHARGILHRDIHGNNILVDLGREPTASLIDAGMVEFEAKFYATTAQRYLTPPEARVQIGTGGLETLPWTAPEARAGKGWTAKSDVYSLGLQLYRLLTGGKKPAQHEHERLALLRKHAPSCPPALAAAMMGALVDDPAERVDTQGLIGRLEAAADELAEIEAEAMAAAADEIDERVVDEAAVSSTLAVEAEAGNARATGTMPAIIVPELDKPLALIQPVLPPPLDDGVQGGASPVFTPPAVRRRALIGEVLAASLLCAVTWLSLRETPRAPERPIVLLARPAAVPSPVTTAAAPATPLTARAATSTEAPPLPILRDALDAAAPALRRCSALAGGLLRIEFETAENLSKFARVAVPHADDVVRRCVDDATLSLRFEPAGDQTLAQEYTP
ncbi:protein kinase domain-containing protein [Nannocystis pusilla]|uniref:Protein kinase n=1 Tax=Nannocystis pusilla TaxID=889268 RepID=A0ABS7TJ40_9BACT|nr:protein kinase [Nannocystis pusilla]MBZ5708213.1 protein kinase [Nannocystis pusilla]